VEIDKAANETPTESPDETGEGRLSRRIPWRAALLGVLTTGLGQVYSGRPIRAICLHVLSVCIGFVSIRTIFVIPIKLWNVVLPLAAVLIWWLFALADAVWCARRAAPDYRLRRYNRWYFYLLLAILAFGEQSAVKGLFKARLAEAFRAVSWSMLPTIQSGDDVFVDKRAYAGGGPQRGDIVSLHYPLDPSVLYFKRVIGVGGDVLKMVNNKVYVNGQYVSEPYTQFEFANSLPIRDNFPPDPRILEKLPTAWGLDPGWTQEMPNFIRDDGLHVPAGYVFVLGDNRHGSLDSRYWGFVPTSGILGKAAVIYFSWDAKAHRIRWERIGKILK